jgi:uncharacterized repeat protein (TIGR02543 family)
MDLRCQGVTGLIITGSYELSGLVQHESITPINVSASAGKLPYTYSATGLPAGITINSANGVISGAPTSTGASGTAVITVSDSNGVTASVDLYYSETIGLTFAYSPSYDIPFTTVGTSITHIDVSSGVSNGTQPYTFSAEGLPDGVTISSSGIISGTPTIPSMGGNVRITVTDNVGTSRTINTSHGTIYPVDRLTQVEDNFPIWTRYWRVGEPIDPIYLSEAISGGVPPYYYEVTSDLNPLPSGVILNEYTGLVTGAVAQVQDTGDVAYIGITDSIGDWTWTTINWGEFRELEPMSFLRAPYEAAQDIPAAYVGQSIGDVKANAFSFSYEEAVRGGLPPFTFSATGLPAGLFMTTDGNLYGAFATLQAAGTATVTARDYLGTERSVTINYGAVTKPPEPLTFTYDMLYDIPASTVGAAIASIDVSGGVSNGTAPYTFSAMGLPEGITISAAGLISGTPTQEDDADTALIFVGDSAGGSDAITINIGAITPPGTPLSFEYSPDYDIPLATVGSAINDIYVAPGIAGGTGPYTFTAAGLPAGISISAAGLISGTPTATGTAGTATITVTDSAAPTPDTKSITISYGTICAAGTLLTFTNSAAFNIPASSVGAAIAEINVASGVAGGTAPHTYIAEDLPDGLFITSAGVIMGTPEAAVAAGAATITVTDSLSPDPNTASITISYGAITGTTYTVTFNGNGGTSSEATRSVYTGMIIGALPSATRPGGYTFNGWFTSASGGAQITAATTVGADVTYYAQWTFTGGGGTPPGGGGGLTPPTEQPTTPPAVELPDGATLETPDGQDPVVGDDGTITLPGGGTVTTGDDVTITVPPDTTIGQDGDITIPQGGTATVETPGGASVTLPGGSTITDGGSTLTVGSGGGTVTYGDGSTARVPGGTVIDILDAGVPLGGFDFLFPAPFADVPTDAWYYFDLMYTMDIGLIKGKTADSYEPEEFFTYAEAVTLAARMHQLYTTGGITLDNGEPVWYQSYVDYALENGIISNTNYDWDAPATRADYVAIFANALPEEALPFINEVADGSIPDVPMDHPQAAAIYKLYRVGILEGVDGDHYFLPDTNIKDCEIAVVAARMMNPEARVEFSI